MNSSKRVFKSSVDLRLACRITRRVTMPNTISISDLLTYGYGVVSGSGDRMANFRRRRVPGNVVPKALSSVHKDATALVRWGDDCGANSTQRGLAVLGRNQIERHPKSIRNALEGGSRFRAHCVEGYESDLGSLRGAELSWPDKRRPSIPNERRTDTP